MTDFNMQDEELCNRTKSFIKLFYDTMDRKRERTMHMYADDDPTIVWNGNSYTGLDIISQFMTNLPPTHHEPISLDAQHVSKEVAGAEMIVLLVAGSVTISEVLHAYTETFTLIQQDMILKVKSQRFRYVD